MRRGSLTTTVLVGLLAVGTAAPAVADEATSATGGGRAAVQPPFADERDELVVDTPVRVEIDEPNMTLRVQVAVDEPVDHVSAHLRQDNGYAFGPGRGGGPGDLVPGTDSTYLLEIPWNAASWPYTGSYHWTVTTQRRQAETGLWVRTGTEVPVVVRLGSRQSLNVVRDRGVVRITGETRAYVPSPAATSDYTPWPGQTVSVQRLDESTGRWVEVGRPVGDQRARFTVKTLAPAGTQLRAVVSRTPAVWGSTSPTVLVP